MLAGLCAHVRKRATHVEEMGVSRRGKKARSMPFELLTKSRTVRVRRRRRSSLGEGIGDDCSDATSAKRHKGKDDGSIEREEEEEEMVGEREVDLPNSEVSSADEEEEEAVHSRLLSAISELGGQRRQGQRSEATQSVSQFQLSSDPASGEVRIGDLLHGVGEEGRGVASLRRQLATATNHQLLPPATKQQVEKAHRALAYSAACRDVGKWLPVVTHNRKAEHLSFPLQEERVPPPSLSTHTQHFQAVTELEKAVMDVMDRSEDVVEATDAELTAVERAELVRVMGQEARERVRESRRWRKLMSQYEAKCQRERRIKSRRFHKVQRKRHEKASEGVTSEGVTGEGVTGEEEKAEKGEEEKAEKLRATERMTLRHSRQGKWAREVLARKKKNPAAQSALSEHSMRGRALTLHQQPVESEEESDSGTEAHADTLPPTCHGNPWLQPSAPVLLLNSSPGVEEERQAQEVSAADHRSTGSQPCDDVPSSASKLKNPLHRAPAASLIDPTAFISPRKEGVSLGTASQQLLHVHEAFAGDNVVTEFAREKEALTAVTETPSLALPGWGVWGGDGTKQNKKKQVKPKKLTKPRSDRELDHVIIGDHGNVKINKHLVKRLPWPFSSTQQFNRAQATPIGRHWNSEMVHRQMVTPRVETAVGVAIPPIKLTDDVQDFMRRQDRKTQDTRRQDRKTQDTRRQDRKPRDTRRQDRKPQDKTKNRTLQT